MVRGSYVFRESWNMRSMREYEAKGIEHLRNIPAHYQNLPQCEEIVTPIS
ncbi:hypothetical protein JMJ77_0007459 [Colletotrichum scovillei]|uniref:Uncharacterized protein n=1 Tax=Colletotrichum scovillei TaxID=1209932 RepID=A0A9P7RCJ9_9PEZI|nr:hypothetical protein JMJ77_0007459 [Colletotrichum scovillei]KAG7074462.1 hypothetical protein JMJ76_0010940 [Colletotrichum scovillei]KAG7081543.1 hypothetical protein JMJ78_0003661 [Colletotrichum scovillei]